MLSENLKKIRAEKGLSLRALSAISGVSKSTLNDLENENITNSTIKTLDKIAQALEVSREELLENFAEEEVREIRPKKN